MAVHILEGEGEFRAVQDDGPSQIQPDHKQGDGGQHAVNGALLGDHHLCFQVQVLYSGEGDTRNDGGFQGMPVVHLGSGNVFIHRAHDKHADTCEGKPRQQGLESVEELEFAGED